MSRDLVPAAPARGRPVADGEPLVVPGGWAHALRQVAALARRSSLAYLRRPGTVAFPMVFPLFFAALSSSSFSRATGLPGFPEVDGFVDFVAAATITQGVLFGGIQAGTDLARDVQDGYFERLMASPVARPAIVLGHLGGCVAMGLVQAAFFVVMFSVAGASVHTGPVGVLALVLYGGVVALAIGGLMAGLALRTGSTEAVQGSFPLVFVLLFLSSAWFPTALMEGWYQAAAEHNPLTWMVDGARGLFLEDHLWPSAGKALGVAGGLAVLSVSWALWQLRRRASAR